MQRNEIVLDLIGRAYKKTRQCDFLVAKKKFMTVNTGLYALVKNSPYTRRIALT